VIDSVFDADDHEAVIYFGVSSLPRRADHGECRGCMPIPGANPDILIEGDDVFAPDAVYSRELRRRARIAAPPGLDDLGAALQRAQFLLHDILAGLITPAPARTEPAQPPVLRKPTSIQ
jgi:hypothetical protein